MNAQTTTSLGNTYWRLVEADGRLVPAELRDAGEPHLQVDCYSGRAAGFTAVNHFRTEIDQRGSRLRFASVASTRRTGPPPALEVESALMRSLAAARFYRISGDRLELLAASGAPVARFEAKLAP